MRLEEYISRVKDCVSQFQDNRKGKNKSYTMQEIGMGAYSVFHMQSPSFLAHQQNMKKTKGQHNGQTLFGFEQIPSDNHIRQCLDTVDPSSLAPFFENITSELDPAEWTVKGRWLIAIDGVTFFSSSKINCSCCLKKEHSNGSTTYSHAALCPVIVHPLQKLVIPLMPEFIRNEDGTEKQDCEINAAKRWIEKNQEFLTQHNAILIADDLFSRDPFIKLINRMPNLDYIFVAKPTSHTYMTQWINDLTQADKTFVTIKEKAYASHVHDYMIATDIPLNSLENTANVHYFYMQVENKKCKKLYANSFVTSLTLNAHNIHQIATLGRNRWKIENEAFNTLKTKGYHLKHNFGHGKKYLANLLALMNIIAFTIHTLWQLRNPVFAKMFTAFSSRQQFFQSLVTLTLFHLFESWDHFLDFVKDGL